MKKLAPMFALAAALAILAGCQNAEEAPDVTDAGPDVAKPEPEKAVTAPGDPVGTYEAVFPAEAMAQIQQMRDQGAFPKDAPDPSMTFTLNADGSATMSFTGPSPQGTTTGTGKGTWKVEGDKVQITPTEATENGKPVTDPAQLKPIVLAWNADKTMLESDEANPDGSKMQFKKKA